MGGQTKVISRTIEMYLRCFTSTRPKEWIKWVAWAKYCYKLASTPLFNPLRSRLFMETPPILLSYVPGIAKVQAVKDALQRDQVLKEL